MLLLTTACGVTRPGLDSTSLGAVGFDHTQVNTSSCTNCHEKDRPAPANGIPHGNGGDCVSCHKPAPTWPLSLTSGFSHTPVPTSCNSCHLNKQPQGLINRFDHALITGQDCVGCHKANVGISWAGGVYGHSPTPTSCTTCHAANLPTGTVPNTIDGFNHSATYGSECASCHLTVTTNLGVRWSGGFFNHNNNNAGSFTSCSPCHDTRQHHDGTNCTSCHTQVQWPTPSPTGNFGGSFGPGG